MRPNTRLSWDAYCVQLAKLNGVSNVSGKFTVAPSVEQTLNDRVRESTAFLQAINLVPVDQQKGETLGLGTNGPAAGRTDTNLADREPRNLVAMDQDGYTCEQTNFDTFISYDKLDTWAKFPDFQPRVRNQTTQQVARDRLCIGWNGVQTAATTNIALFPLLQDVNIGWLQKLRVGAPQRVLSGIKIGTQAGADYRNVDAAVFDGRNELLAPWHRQDTDIITIVGSKLLNDKYMAMINSPDGDAPTEKQALQTLILNQSIGGRKAMAVPFFPEDAMLICKPSNLSIYWQSGTLRRHVDDQPRRNRVVDYLSMNESYVIEDLEACALIENIQVPDGIGGWA